MTMNIEKRKRDTETKAVKKEGEKTDRKKQKNLRRVSQNLLPIR